MNVLNLNGESPLVLAAIPGHENIIALLVSAGANINRQTATGATALLYSGQYTTTL